MSAKKKKKNCLTLTGKPEKLRRSKNQAAAKYDSEAQLTTYNWIPNYDYPTYLHLELHHSILEPLGKIEAVNQNPNIATFTLQ